MKLLTIKEEDELVILVKEFAESGFAPTHFEISKWALHALQLRMILLERSLAKKKASSVEALSVFAKKHLEKCRQKCARLIAAAAAAAAAAVVAAAAAVVARSAAVAVAAAAADIGDSDDTGEDEGRNSVAPGGAAVEESESESEDDTDDVYYLCDRMEGVEGNPDVAGLDGAAQEPQYAVIMLSRKWFQGFYRRHPALIESIPKMISPQRAMASTPQIRDKLFKAREALALKLGVPDSYDTDSPLVGIIENGVLDQSRIFNSDECPNPMNGNPSGVRHRQKVVSVKPSRGRSKRPCMVGTEKHDVNVTIDPIVSMDGTMYTTQVHTLLYL